MFFKLRALKQRLQRRCFPVRSSHREVFLKKGVTAQKMRFSIKVFFSKSEEMYTEEICTADLVTFTEEIRHGKFHFLCSVFFFAS